MAGQRFGEVVAGFGPSGGRAPFSAGLFTAPSACEGDPDGERQSQGVALSSKYFSSEMLRPRCAGSSAFSALQSLAQTLSGSRRRVAAALREATGQAEPPSARCPRGRAGVRVQDPRGTAGSPPDPASSLVSPERVPHGDGLPQRGQHLVPVCDAHPAGRRADEDVARVVSAAVLAALSHRHPQGQVLRGSTRPSQQPSTDQSPYC